MHALDAARRLLDRERVAERVRAARAAEEAVEAKARELAAAERRIGWWDRAVFFHDTPDEAAADALREELAALGATAAEARRARDEAVEACAEGAPAIGVVYRAEAAIGRLLSMSAVGRVAGSGDQEAAVFDRVGEQVFATWLPDVDLAAVAASLYRRDLAIPTAPPAALSTDARLVYAPIGAAELEARAAHHLVARGLLAEARQQEARAVDRVAPLRAELAELEAAVGIWDRVVPGDSFREMAVDEAQQRLETLERGAVSAAERGQLAVVQALTSAYPPLWVGLACLAVGAALRAVHTLEQPALQADGTLGARPAAQGRAVALACAAGLRRALDGAFDGLSERIAPRAAQPDEAASAQRGPYRAAQRPDADPKPAARGATAEGRRFFASLDEAALRDELGWAVVHATALGLIERTRAEADAEVSWVDRAIFWSDSDAEAEVGALSERIELQRELVRLRGYRALRRIADDAGQDPFLRVGRAIERAHLALGAVHTEAGRSSSPRSCPAHGKGEARAAIDAALTELCTSFGAARDGQRMIEDVCRQLTRGATRSPPTEPPPAGTDYASLVARFAHALRGTSFADDVARLNAALPALQSARASATSADAQVRLIDRINIFTDSPAERARDHSQALAAQHQADLERLRPAVRARWRAAIATHPPTLAAEVAMDVARAIGAVRGVSVRRSRSRGKNRRREVYYVCQLRGLAEAKGLLQTWTAQVVGAFGRFPSTGDLLEQWTADALR